MKFCVWFYHCTFLENSILEISIMELWAWTVVLYYKLERLLNCWLVLNLQLFVMMNVPLHVIDMDIFSKNIRRLCELCYFYLYNKFNILVPMCFNEEIHGQWMDPSLFNPLSCIFAGVEKKVFDCRVWKEGIRLKGLKRKLG